MFDNEFALPYPLVSSMEMPRDKRLFGQWQGPTGQMELREDDTGVTNGEAIAWFVAGDVLTLAGSSGILELPYQVSDSILTLFNQGQPVVFQRRAAPAPAAIPAASSVVSDLVGKWTYLGRSTTYAASSRSTASLTLNADGTYEYGSEYSASGEAYTPYSMAAQRSDCGTWSATDTTLTLHSVTQASHTLSLQKLNHPKNGDPMIVLDGVAYVTFYQKPSWR
jgi:hypothetical protein